MKRVCFGVSVCNCKHVGDDDAVVVSLLICLSLSFCFSRLFVEPHAEYKKNCFDRRFGFKMCDVEKRNESTAYVGVCFAVCQLLTSSSSGPVSLRHPLSMVNIQIYVKT